jgi:hypothetical protein
MILAAFFGGFGRGNGLAHDAAKLIALLHQDRHPLGRKQPGENDKLQIYNDHFSIFSLQDLAKGRETPIKVKCSQLPWMSKFVL